jgi:hypothetical protein
MSTLFKTTALSLGLLTAIAVSAQAQTMSNTVVPGQSIANLPPEGPRASSHNYIPPETQMPVAQSGNYPGPGPGATNGPMPPHYQTPADWDQNVAMHPYTSGAGPKAH